jgi:hypothetical protein
MESFRAKKIAKNAMRLPPNKAAHAGSDVGHLAGLESPASWHQVFESFGYSATTKFLQNSSRFKEPCGADRLAGGPMSLLSAQGAG